MAHGHNAARTAGWGLYAKDTWGKVCERANLVFSDGADYEAGGCSYHMPLDYAELSGGTNHLSARVIYGPVTLVARVVRVNLSDGSRVVLSPQGASAGFQRAFYIGPLGTSAVVVSVYAYDARGREVGHVTANQSAEQQLAGL